MSGGAKGPRQSTVIDFETFFGASGWTPWSATRSRSRYSIFFTDIRNARRWRTTLAAKTKSAGSPDGGVSTTVDQ